ncbi:MAG: chloride channel protein [Deltaproteobacteria bacterium]|nr:chloride channel protein [Deltaproteobacteria bacterium]
MSEAKQTAEQRSAVARTAAPTLYARLGRTPTGRGVFRLVLAAILGVATAYGSLLFRALIGAIARVAFPGGIRLRDLRAASPLRLILSPAIGGAIVGPLIRLLAPEARGHGVPEVMDACSSLGGRIRGRVAVCKTLASGITIGSGGSVGREGPIVQIGAALGSKLGQLVGMRGQYLIDTVAAGAAAGIAATFDAPIAGVVFASELILGRGSVRHMGPLIVAAVISTAAVHAQYGAHVTFLTPSYTLVSAWELALYLLIGLCAALVGVAFIRFLYFSEDLWTRLPLPIFTHATIGGAIIGLLALKFPQVMGVGYETIEGVLGTASSDSEAAVLHGPAMLVLLIALKIFATSTTIGSGGSGGVFAPSLFLGACLGGSLGSLFNRWVPSNEMGPPGAYGLVGMGAVVAATTHAPLTAILIVFELCNRHSIILPLMFACTLASLLSSALARESIYTVKLKRRSALRAAMGGQSAQFAASDIGTLMTPTRARVWPTASLAEIVDRATACHAHTIYVTDHKRRLLGFVTMDDVASHIQDDLTQRRKLRAKDVMHAAETLRPEHSLERCLTLLQNPMADEVPIVDGRLRLIGRITRADLVRYYSREALARDTVLSFVDGQWSAPAADAIRLADGDVKGQIVVAGFLAGSTLSQLNLTNRFGVRVYAFRPRGGETTIPDQQLPLSAGDTLFVVGPQDEVNHLIARAKRDPSELTSPG